MEFDGGGSSSGRMDYFLQFPILIEPTLRSTGLSLQIDRPGCYLTNRSLAYSISLFPIEHNLRTFYLKVPLPPHCDIIGDGRALGTTQPVRPFQLSVAMQFAVTMAGDGFSLLFVPLPD